MKQMTKFLADECVFSLTVELLKNTGWNKNIWGRIFNLEI